MQIAEYLTLYANCFLCDEAGASLVEYALIGLLILVVCMLVLLAFDKSMDVAAQA